MNLREEFASAEGVRRDGPLDFLGWDGDVPAQVHPSLELWTHREFFGTNSFAAWAGVAVFLASFGVVINNTARGGEPKIGTMMVGLGFLFLLWSSIVFFHANLPIQNRPAILALLILIILLLCVIVLIAVRIWRPLGKPEVVAVEPIPVFDVPPPSLPHPCRPCHKSHEPPPKNISTRH